MGLTMVLIGVAVDLNDAGGPASVLGATLVVAALAVTVATNLPYLRRYRQVRMRRTPSWTEWALGLCSATAFFLIGNLLNDNLAYSFALGGVVGALPFLLWALRLRRAA